MPYARRFLPPTVGSARRFQTARPRLLPPGMCPPGYKFVQPPYGQGYCAQLPSTPQCPPGFKLVWNGYHHECWQLPSAPPPPQFQGAYFGDVVAPYISRIPIGGPTPTGLSYRPPTVSRIPIPRPPPGIRYVPDEGDLDFTPYTPTMPRPAPAPLVPPAVFLPAPVPVPGLPVPVPHVPLPVPVEVPITEMLPVPPMCPPPCDYYDAEELVRAWLCACQSSCP